MRWCALAVCASCLGLMSCARGARVPDRVELGLAPAVCEAPKAAHRGELSEVVFGAPRGGRRASVAALEHGRYVLALGGALDREASGDAAVCEVGALYDRERAQWRCVSPGPWAWERPLIVPLHDGSALVMGSSVDPESVESGGCRAGTLTARYLPSEDRWVALAAAPAWIDAASADALALPKGQVVVTSARHPEPKRVDRAQLERYARWTLVYDLDLNVWASYRESEMLVRGQSDFGRTRLLSAGVQDVLRVSPVGPDAIWDHQRRLWVLTSPKWTRLVEPSGEAVEAEVQVFKPTQLELAWPEQGWIALRRYGARWLFERYERERWVWAKSSVAVTWRVGAAMSAQGGGVLVTGGGAAGQPCGREVVWVEPALGVSLPLAPLSEGRQHHAQVRLNDREALLVGGVCEAPHKTCGLADLLGSSCATVNVSPERYSVPMDEVVGRLGHVLVQRALDSADAATR